MCLLFFESKDTREPDEYQLVLANVRDEYYTRPTKPAEFWDDQPTVIGGRDLLEGREGGTWIAMNKANGKIGVLLNILQPRDQLKHNGIGRGFIVNDYVMGSESHKSYLDKLNSEGDSYNGFVMIAMEFQNARLDCSYYSNQFNQSPKPLDYGTHGFGNSLDPHQPWFKVSHGKKRFESIMTGHRTTNTKRKLVQDLFEMLSDKTIYPLDGQMLKQGNSWKRADLEKLNSLFVEIPPIMYGSRTWTLILVDGSGNVDYIENTMKEPITCTPDGTQPEWLLTSYNFSNNDSD